MTTREELKQKESERKKLIERIERITKALSEDELNLIDINSYEEQLQETCSDLQELMQKIIELRQYLDLEEFDIYSSRGPF